MKRNKRMLTCVIALAAALCLLLGASPLCLAAQEEQTDIAGQFTDEILRRIVYDAIGKEPGAPIYAEDAAGIEELALVETYGSDETTVYSLDGLEYCTGLRSLRIVEPISELKLERLQNLERLVLIGSNVKTLDISGLDHLVSLSCLLNPELTQLTVSCPSLTELMCKDSKLTELDLSGCPNLRFLDCGSNLLTELDVSPCMEHLEVLDCSGNAFTDASAIRGLIHWSNNRTAKMTKPMCWIISETDDPSDYSADSLILRVRDTPQTRDMLFCCRYIEDYEAYNAANPQFAAGPVEAIVSQLGLDFPISGAWLLNASQETENGKFRLQEKQNSLFRITLDGITVPEAIEKLNANPLIAFAEPNHLAQHCAEDGQTWLDDSTAYREDTVLICLRDTPQTRAMLFCCLYSDDYAAFNEVHQNAAYQVVAEPVENIVVQLGLDIPISGVKLLNPSVETENGKYRLQEKHNSIFSVLLDGITVAEAIEKLNENPLIAYAEPDFYVDPATPEVASWTDVKQTDWFYPYVYIVCEKKLMNGVGKGLFAPESSTTRAQFATILYRAAGAPAVEYKGTFSDVPEGTWYSEAVEWAAANGYVKGVGGGRFSPDGEITREQIAAILYRYAGSPKGEGSLKAFRDAGSVSGYAVDAMIWATGEGIINGVGSASGALLQPQANATRAQIAAIFARFLSE